MGKGSAPAAPDYSQIAAASEKAAEYSFALGLEQLDWAKEQYKQDREITDVVVDKFLKALDQNTAAAEADRQRYENIYQPLEDQLVKDAEDFASPERIGFEMGRAQAGVGQQYDSARDQARRELEAYGINPSATRYAGLDIGLRAQEAAAKAAAGTNAAVMTDAQGRALRSEAINVGRGYPGQVAGTYATALAAGNGAVGNNLNTTASGANTMGTATQWQGLGNQSLGQWTNALNTQFNNQLASYNAQQASSSGLGGILGGVLGIGSKLFGFEDGGAVPALDGEILPPDEAGGAIPIGASPSRGAVTDDIPARLNAGEFIIPREAVEWFGQKHMHSLIEKAQKERSDMEQRTGAVPAITPGPEQAFASGGSAQSLFGMNVADMTKGKYLLENQQPSLFGRNLPTIEPNYYQQVVNAGQNSIFGNRLGGLAGASEAGRIATLADAKYRNAMAGGDQNGLYGALGALAYEGNPWASRLTGVKPKPAENAGPREPTFSDRMQARAQQAIDNYRSKYGYIPGEKGYADGGAVEPESGIPQHMSAMDWITAARMGQLPEDFPYNAGSHPYRSAMEEAQVANGPMPINPIQGAQEIPAVEPEMLEPIVVTAETPPRRSALDLDAVSDAIPTPRRRPTTSATSRPSAGSKSASRSSATSSSEGLNFIGYGNEAIEKIRSGKAPKNSYALPRNSAGGNQVMWANTGPGGSAKQVVQTAGGRGYETSKQGTSYDRKPAKAEKKVERKAEKRDEKKTGALY